MRVTTDDAVIDIETTGKGNAIVLIHGFPLTRDVWDAQAAELAKIAFVIRPDLRGMGRSSVPDGPYLMETLAADIAAILDALGIERAALAGHSLGGYVSLAFARMYTERTERLALVCSRLAADSEQTARAREELADRAERENSMDVVVEAYVPRLSACGATANEAVISRAEELARRTSPRGAASMLRGMAQRADSYDITEDLAMPVLIAAGAADRNIPLEEAQEMQRAFPNATLKTLDHSGHLPMLEEPEELTALLTSFVCESS